MKGTFANVPVLKKYKVRPCTIEGRSIAYYVAEWKWMERDGGGWNRIELVEARVCWWQSDCDVGYYVDWVGNPLSMYDWAGVSRK